MQFRAGAVVLAVVVMSATACNDDGRTLRPPRSDQNASVSTMAETTEPEPTFSAAPTIAPTSAPATSAGADGATIAGSGLTLTSTAFTDGGAIPARFTCQGDNVSPELTWSAAPAGTVEIAITMDDLDAPGYVHWAVAAIDPLSTSLGEGVVPQLAVQAQNGAGQLGYTGPCPPPGETHRYRITVHYLSEQTELGNGAAGADLVTAIGAATLESASITGTYSQS
jgi:Raf kinase inhibitor-like YbhB/YbcL family protein